MIVPMKKAHILVLKEDQNKLLQSLQRYGVFMPISISDNTIGDTIVEEQNIQRTQQTLKLLSKYQEKKSFGNFNVVNYDEFANIDPKRHELLENVEKTKLQIDELKQENEAISERQKYFMPWVDLDIKLNEVNDTKYTIFHIGYLDPKNLEKAKDILLDAGSAFYIFGDSDDGKAFIFINYYQEDKEIYQKIKNLGFVDTELPKEDEYVNRIVFECEAKINSNNEKIIELEKLLNEYASNIKELEILNDQLLTKSELKKVRAKKTNRAVYLEGWVRSDQVEVFKKAVAEATSIYDLEIRDPNEDETPPTATKNNKFVEMFEPVTEMFATPNHQELDPNPPMAPWYWIIFGMMMGDAGYGLVMILLFALLINIMKPKGNSLKLMKMLMYSGITTIFWGVLFGSYFGATWNPILLVPMEQPLEMLILSVAIGALHIITGLIVKAYANIIDKKYFSALFDQFSWIMVLVGIGLLFLPSYANVGKALIIIGAIIIILTAGRAKKNIFGKIGGGFTGLFGITGYMSDILSYSRILALSLSSAVIAMVMNMLAGMLQASVIGFIFSIPVYIIGHVFNIGMSLLSAYVHDSRLQYIEFYGKFYEGGGYAFKPLSLQLKYVDDVKLQ